MGHKYPRQTINSETQIRAALTSAYYELAAVKVKEVEKVKE